MYVGSLCFTVFGTTLLVHITATFPRGKNESPLFLHFLGLLMLSKLNGGKTKLDIEMSNVHIYSQ